MATGMPAIDRQTCELGLLRLWPVHCTVAKIACPKVCHLLGPREQHNRSWRGNMARQTDRGTKDMWRVALIRLILSHLCISGGGVPR